MFPRVSHVYHLMRAGLVFARYDVIPDDQVAAAPWPARSLLKLAKMFAGKPSSGAKTGLNAALQALGPSYIKLGQFLATRPDFVGKQRANELSALQDRLGAYPQDVAEAVVERELNQPLKDVFVRFGPAVAAASIAQVHKATTGKSAEPVAVKILRPNVKKRFKKDLDAFFFAARLAERFSATMRRLRPVEALNVLARTVDLEMDLRMEAAAIAEMAENTRDDSGFGVPDVDWQRTSGRVLTMQWIDGIALNAPDQLAAAGIDMKKLADNVIQSFLRHAIRDGFFHADMHQGNLFVDQNGDLIAVDFGITGRLSVQDRQVLAEVLYGFINKDYLRVAQVHFDAGYVPADQDVEVFAQSLRAIGEPIMDKPAEEISMGHLLGQLLEGTERFNMKTQPQLILLQKTMVVVEGVARSLYPKFNMWEASEPFVKEWMEKRLGPQGKLEDLAHGASALAGLALAFPEILQQARNTAKTIADLAEAENQSDIENKGKAWPRAGVWALWVGATSLAVLAISQIL